MKPFKASGEVHQQEGRKKIRQIKTICKRGQQNTLLACFRTKWYLDLCALVVMVTKPVRSIYVRANIMTSSAASYLGKSHLSLKVTSQGQPKIDEQFCQYLAGVR